MKLTFKLNTNKMKRLSILLLTMISVGLVTLGCNNTTASKDAGVNTDSAIIADAIDSEVLEKELDAAFSKMFENTTFTNATDYFKTDVSDDYFTINADGVTQNKDELLADTDRLKMLEKASFKFYDQKTRIYGNVGILNGRSQAFFDGTYVAEFLYTAIFVKDNGTWKYTSWQGTWSKDTPPPAVLMEKD